MAGGRRSTNGLITKKKIIMMPPLTHPSSSPLPLRSKKIAHHQQTIPQGCSPLFHSAAGWCNDAVGSRSMRDGFLMILVEILTRLDALESGIRVYNREMLFRRQKPS